MPYDIGEKTKRSIFWVTSARICNYIIEFVGGVIVARILFPQDFGIMAIAMIFVHFAQRLGEFGFNVALIQKEKITQDHIFTIFMINLGMGIILCLSLVGTSPFIGKFYDNDLVGKVLAVVSIEFILRGLASTPLALLQRELKYAQHSAISFINIFFSTGVTVLLAFLNFEIWSLVFGRLTASATEIISIMIITKWIPKFRYKHWAMKEMFSFGIWMFLRAQLAYFLRNIDYFIISKRLGVVPLGFYERGSNLVIASQRLIGIGIQQVSFSSFSRIQKDNELLKNTFQKILTGLSLYNYPILIGMFLIAPSFIPVVYGEKWIPTILPLQVLCFSGIPRSLEFLSNSFATAKGDLKKFTGILALHFIFLSIACFIGSSYGIVGVAIAVSISGVFIYILLFNFLMHIGGFKLMDILTPQIPALIYVSIMALGVKSWELVMKNLWQIQSFPMLISSILVGGILYIGALFTIRFKQTEFLRLELMTRIKS
ncbi:MAG: lipopolysaccharide biosynthesis protein [bacterium]